MDQLLRFTGGMMVLRSGDLDEMDVVTLVEVPGEEPLYVATGRLASWVDERVMAGGIQVVECLVEPTSPVRTDVPYVVVGQRDDGMIIPLSPHAMREGPPPGPVTIRIVILPQDDWEEFLVDPEGIVMRQAGNA